ncbi:PD-(D/E)XK motif protein [Horticoccus sp. 23ND18S-11]|uniref:PD-(D/E)XK motif protein n=1 Tax=Horticoccus sp. 23ND18S-11 TaxID=3391832 RepID=UPI0039C98EC1
MARRVEQEGGEPVQAVAVFISQLARWQRLLAASVDGLSANAQRGLWGELHFLRTLLAGR